MDLKRVWSKIFIAGLFVLLLSNLALAKPEIMPLEELESGMQGVGKTVLRGTEVEEFAVEVVSILEDQNPGQNLILVKTSGDVIERTGGIASGMSGSPVYVEGKLIGAIGYGWQMANHKIGMVTPIEDMLNVFNLEEKNNEEIMLDQPVEVSGDVYNQIKFSADEETTKDSKTLVAKPVSTPLSVDGVTGRAKNELADKLDDYDVKTVKSAGLATKKKDIPLKPGSAVAVQLVRGDINVSAIGTLTYLDQNKMLGFGHPFLSKGASNYLLSSAYIHQMITSVKMPFKIGSPAELKGVVTQDRSAGLAGEIGKFPNVVPLEIEVVDKNLDSSQNFNLQIIHDEELLPQLSSVALLQAIDSTIDRQGAGTAQVDLEIMSSDLPDKVLKIDNLYNSSSDVAASSVEDFSQVLGLLTTNPFQEVNFANIKLEVKVDKEPRVALLEEVNLDKKEVKPGGQIEAEIKFRPYREEVITKNVTLEVPEEVNNGNLEFYVLSGQNANVEQITSQSQNGDSNFKTNNIKSLEELIEIYNEQKQNNQLVVQLKKSFSPQAQQSQEKSEETNREEKPQENPQEDPQNSDKEGEDANTEEAAPAAEYNNSLAESVLDTDYVLQGAVRKQIKIKKEEKVNSSSKKEKKDKN
ncbi:MAG: SpoIVB peptidase S55 domain-containing protein [Bacillota bacterium]